MIQLSRFSFNHLTGAPTKAMCPITYPIVLDLPFEIDGSVSQERYSLQAVIDHEGETASSGHYATYARRFHETAKGKGKGQGKGQGKAESKGRGKGQGQDKGQQGKGKGKGSVQWFKINDTVISQVSEDEVLRPLHLSETSRMIQTPYILLCQKTAHLILSCKFTTKNFTRIAVYIYYAFTIIQTSNEIQKD